MGRHPETLHVPYAYLQLVPINLHVAKVNFKAADVRKQLRLWQPKHRIAVIIERYPGGQRGPGKKLQDPLIVMWHDLDDVRPFLNVRRRPTCNAKPKVAPTTKISGVGTEEVAVRVI
jgi:hypothetical protein